MEEDIAEGGGGSVMGGFVGIKGNSVKDERERLC